MTGLTNEKKLETVDSPIANGLPPSFPTSYQNGHQMNGNVKKLNGFTPTETNGHNQALMNGHSAANGFANTHHHENGVNNNNEFMNGHAATIVNPDFNPRDYDQLLAVAEAIREQVNIKEVPKIGIICGTGLSELGEMLRDADVLPYTRIPGFPRPSVVGHKGNLVFGYIGDKYVVCLQGRFHPYEHQMDLALCATPVRILHLLGVQTLIVSNAAGGINPKFNYGDLMLIKDHISMPGLSGFSPLVGMNDPRFGPRFVSIHDAYDKNLRKDAIEIAEDIGLRVHEGIYVMNGGPQYESPAEVAYFKAVGADALGMSTCHEVIVARQCGIRVFGFSLITNIANLDADDSVEVTHEEVLIAAKDASEKACQFVSRIIQELI